MIDIHRRRLAVLFQAGFEAPLYRDVELQPLPVVTDAWGKRRRCHPDTRVLTLDTGFERDCSEGAAYRDYVATDRLMFAVPPLDWPFSQSG